MCKGQAMTRLSAAAIGIMALGAGPVAGAQADEYSKSYSVTGHPEVHVRVDDSKVRVITGDASQVNFHVSRESASGLALGNALKIDSHQDGDRVELTVKRTPGLALGFT